jgi:hypothetical protein
VAGEIGGGPGTRSHEVALRRYHYHHESAYTYSSHLAMYGIQQSHSVAWGLLVTEHQHPSQSQQSHNSVVVQLEHLLVSWCMIVCWLEHLDLV